MDLKRLGVSIDPRGAQTGAKRVEKSLDQMGGKVRRVLTEADKRFMKMGREGQVAGDKVNKGANKATAGLKRTANQARKTGGGVKDVGEDMAFLQAQSVLASAGLFRASGAMAAFGAAATGALAALAPLLAVLLPIIVAVKAFSALFAAGVEGTKLAGEVQRLKISFEALAGSSSEAEKIIGELRATALATGVQIGQQAKTVQKFLALGFNSEDAIKLQRNILDVAGAVGLSASEANLLGTALAQVQAKGVVSMEELRQQIAEKGIPAIEELQRKTGLTGEAFFKAVADGQIASKELIDIFLNLEGSFGKFEGGAKRLAKSIPGQIAIIKTSWQELLREFGTPLAEAVGPILEDVIGILQNGAGFAKSLGQGIGDVIKILYQAISDGKLKDLLGTTFMAGVEIGLNFLANGFIDAVAEFGALIVSALEVAGKTLLNVFKGAFAASVNFFGELLTPVIQKITGVLAGVASFSNKILGTNFSVGSFGGFKKVEPNFNEISFGDILQQNREAGRFAAEQIRDPFGTTFQDDAARQAGDLLERFNRENAGKKFTFQSEEQPQEVETPTLPVVPTGGGASSEAKKVTEELKKQDTILESVTGRLSELGTEWADLGTIVADIAEGAITSFADNLSSALYNVASGAESAGQAFRNMANAVVQSIVQMIIQMTIQLAIAQALAALGVPVGTFAGIAGAARAVPVNHAGSGSNVKTSRGFSKLHEGGVSSENLALTDQNETVLTRKRAEEIERQLASARMAEGQQASGGGSERPIKIVNVLDRSEILETIAAEPDVTVNAISRRRRQVEGVLNSK